MERRTGSRGGKDQSCQKYKCASKTRQFYTYVNCASEDQDIPLSIFPLSHPRSSRSPKTNTSFGPKTSEIFREDWCNLNHC